MATAVHTSNNLNPTVNKAEELSDSVSEISLDDPTIKFNSLKAELSKNASIVLSSDPKFKENAQRWSDYSAPKVAAIINVASEEDICATIKFANENNLPFLAQSGGHGFTSTISKLPENGIIINLRALNKVSVDLPKGEATIEAGTLTNEVIEAAHAAKAHIVTGVCNTVGVVAALLGGGLGNLISLYGLGVDNILSARLITASGAVVTVSATENKELFWGVRGAGVLFGIVSQLTVKAYPQINEGMHWNGTLVFPGFPWAVDEVIAAVKSIKVGKGMGITMLWARPPPDFLPAIILSLWSILPEAEAKIAFRALYSLRPTMQMGGPTPYTKINEFSDMAGKKGGRKPCFAVALKNLDVPKCINAWEAWLEFSGREGAGQSIVLSECYGYEKVNDVDEGETAYPWRSREVHMLASANYQDEKLDEAANEFGNKFREFLREDEGGVYVNFGTGDENPPDMYGNEERLKKLRALKKEWDPEGKFGFYNPIR